MEGGDQLAGAAVAGDPATGDPLLPDRSDSVRRASGRGIPVNALHPLLFAAYPVLFLWSQNLGEVDADDVVVPIALLVAVATLATVAIGRVLGDVRRGALVVTPLAFGLLMYGHVASALTLAPVHVPGIVQQLGWTALVLGAALAAARLPAPRVDLTDTALLRVGAILVAVTLVFIVPAEAGALARPAVAATPSSLPTATSAAKRDVYWLVFDRYGSDRSEKLMYGVDNDLTPWLGDHGFTVLADSHANYVRTALSLAATLSMQHLTDLPGLPSPTTGDLTWTNDRIATALVARQFKALGYRYVHIGSWWAPTRTAPLADADLHLGGPSEFVSTLIDESALPAIQRRLHLSQPVDERVRHYENNQFGLAELRDVADEQPGPKFVFAHVLLPHPPLVYDRDGSFMTGDDTRGLSDLDRYVRQLAFTNDQLRDILTRLTSGPPDRQPIVILQGDEGPWPKAYSANYRDPFDWSAVPDELLEIKFGILNAWYLPPGVRLWLSPTMTSINTFPTLFRDYFGLDYPAVPDRVYTSRGWLLPYDLSDVTTRLVGLH